MSHKSTAKVDQKEYLKKYLSGDKSKKKKRKKDKDKGKNKSRIIDDDATAFQGSGNSDDELLLYGEDAPQIVGEFMETKPNGNENKWRSICKKDEVDVKEEADDDRWGRRANATVKTEKASSKIKRESTPDMSPARRNKNSQYFSSERERTNLKTEDRKRRGDASDQSPPRQRRQKMDSDDLSPPRNRRNGISPHRRGKDSNELGSRDLSPSRRNKISISPRRRRASKDQSPPRRRFEQLEQSRQQRYSNDLSPPRKRRNSISPRRRGDFRDRSPPLLDQSPPRRNGKGEQLRQQRRISRDSSPVLKQRNSLSPRRSNELLDQSPLRRRRGSPDQLQQRRREFSPPRQQKNKFSSNRSPPRNSKELSPQGRNNNIVSRFQKDARRKSPSSPPRRRRRSSSQPNHKRRDFNELSPKRRVASPHQTEYSGVERRSPARFRQRSRSLEPGRNTNEWNSTAKRPGSYTNPFARASPDNDFSSTGKRQMGLPRKRDEFLRKASPGREKNRRDFGNNRRNNSPVRREMSDQSPRRRQRSPRQENHRASPTDRSLMQPPKSIHWETAAMVAKRKAFDSASTSMSPPPTHKTKATKTLDGKKAGLQDARALKEETAARRRDEDKMFEKMSNELSGRDAEVQVRSTGRRGRRARDAEDEDPEKRRQKEERERQRKEQYDRWGKGLKQIEDHRNRLADQEYESSKPLARYADDADLDRHLRAQERAEDPMLDYIRSKRKEKEKTSSKKKVPVYEGSYPENRFGIRPGHRWDGVDRSNGYEKKWFDVQNEKRAVQEDAYKYSVEDM